MLYRYQSIKGKFQRMKQRFQRFRENNWKGTGTPIYWGSLFLFSLCMGVAEGAFIRPFWLGFFLVFLVAFIVAMLGFWLLEKILKLLFRNGAKELLSEMLLCGLCIFVMTWDTYMAGFWETAAFALCFGTVFGLFLRSLWAFLFHKVRTKAVYVSLTLTVVPVLAVAALLLSDGFEDSYIEAYLEFASEKRALQNGMDGQAAALNGIAAQEKADFMDSMEFGDYTIASVAYGVDGTKDLLSETVDISMFAQNKGVNGFLKEWYQGFSLKKVPMEGIIWYPQEISGCPTLFLIHGNHGWTTESYLGYEYLGTYLASHGYVVVSVDENACNGLLGENDGRAVLLLENMRQVQAYNQQQGNPLYQKMDYGNLALAGHSRGGEAIAEACLFNGLEYYPDNGSHTFQYHFSIQSLIAIAPTCGQYQPSGRSVELEDVNYMVLHGANDQDVFTFMGMEQYEDVSFSKEKKCLKTSLYVAGLNHGQFNSRWGKYDMVKPMGHMLNVANFLSQEEQQQIAKIFIKAFLDQTLKGGSKERENGLGSGKLLEEAIAPADLLTDCRKYEGILPRTLYVQSYETSDMHILCNFEEDARLETGTAPGVSVKAGHAKSWWEESLAFSSGEPRGNHAVVLKWEETEAEICISFPKSDLQGKRLQFDLMDMQEGFGETEAVWLEAEAAVTDIHGFTASLPVHAYACIYPAFPVCLNKLQYLWGAVEYKHQFQTVSIPVSDFAGIDESGVCKVTLRFLGKCGKAAVDNIGIRGEW